MLRQLAKSGIAWGLHGTGAVRLLAALNGSSRRPLVLGYHRVVESFEASARGALPGIIISARMLGRQLDWLGRRFRFVSLDELGRMVEERRGFSSPLAAVTFDDGYADVYEHALPLLRRKGIPAAVFVVTDFVEEGGLLLHDRLHLLLSRAYAQTPAPSAALGRLIHDLGLPLPLSLKRRGLPADSYSALRALLGSWPRSALLQIADALQSRSPIDASAFPELRSMSWEMLRGLLRAGFLVGSHTRSHAVLTREDPVQACEEADASRRHLERRLGITVQHFAYPDGGFDDVAVTAVARAGYRFAYTTCHHSDPRHPALTLSRRMLWEASCLGSDQLFSDTLMSCQTTGVFDRLAPCGPTHHRRTWDAPRLSAAAY